MMLSKDELKALEAEELEELYLSVVSERERRVNLERAPQLMDQVLAQYQAAEGTVKVEGAAWVQPTGALDSYPSGATVTHKGKTWVSLTPANVWEPGVSGWREVVSENAAPADFVQPTGAHDTYKKGDRVTYQGKVYTSLIDNNAYSPTDYPAGWKQES